MRRGRRRRSTRSEAAGWLGSTRLGGRLDGTGLTVVRLAFAVITRRLLHPVAPPQAWGLAAYAVAAALPCLLAAVGIVRAARGTPGSAGIRP